jgi:hypothetical protein
VVVLPDGTPGMIAVEATDVFGEPVIREGVPTIVSVEGARRLRALIEVHREKVAGRRRPRPWKVVMHRRGIDPFHRALRVYSSHTVETAARRALSHEKAAMIRTSGYEAAARFDWSVVHDPAGLLVLSPANDPLPRQDDGR